MQLTLVTGSAHKLKEWQRQFPAEFNLSSVALDLPEIQSMDSIQITRDKARRAYEAVKSPVLVEDVSAGIDKFNGLPGPFIKFFEERLGAGALYQLAGEETTATITCTICYYDGTTELFATGVVHGKITESKGTGGFGFDIGFVPNGKTQTFAQMDPLEKDTLSHRHLAIVDMVSQLKQL